jgi:transitional endoplasmic reticulum ATPase
MYRFNTPAYLFVRWTFVALFVLGVLSSFRAGDRLDADQCRELLALTLMAAAAVWVQDRHSWRWTQGALLVLSLACSDWCGRSMR